MITILKTIRHTDAIRKVEIFQRENGSFGFREMKWGKEELAWFQVGKYSECICDTFENTIKEARSRIDWIYEV